MKKLITLGSLLGSLLCSIGETTAPYKILINTITRTSEFYIAGRILLGNTTSHYTVNLGTVNFNVHGTTITATGMRVSSLTITNAYTFPLVDGLINQVLRTDGLGTVSWATVVAAAEVKFIKALYPHAALLPSLRSAVQWKPEWEVFGGSQVAQAIYFPLGAETSAFYMIDVSTHEARGNVLNNVRAYITWFSTTAGSGGNVIFDIAVSSHTIGHHYQTGRTWVYNTFVASTDRATANTTVQVSRDLLGFNPSGGIHYIAVWRREFGAGDTLTESAWVLSMRLEQQ